MSIASHNSLQVEHSTPTTSGAKFASPLFYNDEHAARLLRSHDRHFNVFMLDRDWWPDGRYVASCAHGRQKAADKNLNNKMFGRAVYRIVVRLKTPVSADAPVKVGEPA